MAGNVPKREMELLHTTHSSVVPSKTRGAKGSSGLNFLPSIAIVLVAGGAMTFVLPFSDGTPNSVGS